MEQTVGCAEVLGFLPFLLGMDTVHFTLAAAQKEAPQHTEHAFVEPKRMHARFFLCPSSPHTLTNKPGRVRIIDICVKYMYIYIYIYMYIYT